MAVLRNGGRGLRLALLLAGLLLCSGGSSSVAADFAAGRRGLLAGGAGGAGADGAGGNGGQGGTAVSNAKDGNAVSNGGDAGKSGTQKKKEKEREDLERTYKGFSPAMRADPYNQFVYDSLVNDLNADIAGLATALGGAGGSAFSLDGADGEGGSEGGLAVSNGGCNSGASQCENGGVALAEGDGALAVAEQGFAVAFGGDDTRAYGGGGYAEGSGAALSLPQAVVPLGGDPSSLAFQNDFYIDSDGQVAGGFAFSLFGGSSNTDIGGSAVTDPEGSAAFSSGALSVDTLSYGLGAGFGFGEDGSLDGGIAAGSTLTNVQAGANAYWNENLGAGEELNFVGGETLSQTYIGRVGDGFAFATSDGGATADADSEAGEGFATGVDLEAAAIAQSDVQAGGAGYYASGEALTTGFAQLDIATDEESAAYQVDTGTDSVTDSDFGTPDIDDEDSLIYRFRDLSDP